MFIVIESRGDLDVAQRLAHRVANALPLDNALVQTLQQHQATLNRHVEGCTVYVTCAVPDAELAPHLARIAASITNRPVELGLMIR